MTYDKALCIRCDKPSVDVIEVSSKDEAKKELDKRWNDNQGHKILYAWYQDETEGKSYSLYSIDAEH